ncbi:MAG: hypothetical protein HQ546_10620 [Planctomycetes bacterium]|nr:hypothetical protein [Planctomycetota bacterium]
MKRLMMILAVAALTAGISSAANVVVFDQGFGTDTDGIIFESGDGENVVRVSSGGGTLGVPSGAGDYHAEVTLSDTYGVGFFTRNGGYSSEWPGYIKQSIKIYIDPAAGNFVPGSGGTPDSGDGYFWDAAMCDENGTSWAAGGGFGVQKTASDTWSVGAEDAYGGFHYVGETSAPHGNVTPLDITSAGWYTLATEWVQSPTDLDLIDQVNTVRDSTGTLLWTDTIGDYMSHTAAGVSRAYKDCVAGGISYSWLGSQAVRGGAGSGYDDHPSDASTLYVYGNTMTLLAVDDVHAEILGEPVVPEPAGLGLIGIALLAVRKKRN